MRKFSLKEQNVITSLVNHSKGTLSYVLINVYNDVFYRKNVEYKNGQLVFYRDIDNLNNFDEILSIEKDILDTSFLIRFLKDNRYIYLIDDYSSGGDIKEVGGFIKDGLTPINKDLDKRACEILEEALNHRVFVSEDLIQLVEDGFKTIEEQALEESRLQTSYSRKSFVVAMIALAISLIIPLLTELLSKNEVTLKEDQFERLVTQKGSKCEQMHKHDGSDLTIKDTIVLIENSRKE